MEPPKFTIVLLLVACLQDIASAELQPQAQIVELYGNVLLQIGKPHVIKCEVMDPVSGGVFVWTVGGQTLKNTNSIAEAEDGAIEQELEFTPRKEFADAELSCEYWVDSKLASSDSITLELFSLEILAGPLVSPEVVEEGGAATLSLVASIYPGPVAAEAVTWTISDPSGAASNLLVSAGQATEDGRYTASTVQKLDASEDSYSISLEIATVDELEVSKTHKVVIETQAAKKTVEFQLAMKKASAPGPEEADEKAGGEGILAMSSSFIIIIIIVIVIVIMICIGCFCYRKKQQKTVKNENKEYIAVPVNTAASSSEQRDQV